MWFNESISGSAGATDAADGFPITNVQYRFRQKPYRSANATGTKNLDFDLHSAKNIKAAILLDHNLTSGATAEVFRSSNGSSWSSVGSFTLTRTDNGASIVIDPLVLFFDLTYRYWRLALADASNPDGYIQVGLVFLGGYTQMAKNYQHGWAITTVDLSQEVQASNGVTHVNEKPSYRILEKEYYRVPEAQKDAVRQISDAVGSKQAFFISMRPDDNTHDLYTVYGRFQLLPKPTNNRGRLWDIKMSIKEDL